MLIVNCSLIPLLPVTCYLLFGIIFLYSNETPYPPKITKNLSIMLIGILERIAVASTGTTRVTPKRDLAFCLFWGYVYFMFDENFDRITQNPAVMGGKPCIRGMRVTVGMIVGQIGEGVSNEELLSDYPYLSLFLGLTLFPIWYRVLNVDLTI